MGSKLFFCCPVRDRAGIRAIVSLRLQASRRDGAAMVAAMVAPVVAAMVVAAMLAAVVVNSS